MVLVILVIQTLVAGGQNRDAGLSLTVKRFGRYTRALNSGVNLIVPFFDRIGHKVNN